jgi:hypothetical protein
MAKLTELQELSIELPITSAMRQATERPERWGAVAVEAYLEMQGFGVDRADCYWRNPLEKPAIADVVLPEFGRLECVVMGDGMTIESGIDRLGYVMVMVKEKSIAILGFTDQWPIDVENVMSIDDWMLWLGELAMGSQVIGQMPEFEELWQDAVGRIAVVAQLNRLYHRSEPWEWRYEGEKILQGDEVRELAEISRENGENEGRIDFQDLAESVMERLANVWQNPYL